MSVTDRTIGELERAIRALIAYRDVAKKERDYMNPGPEHAAAFRSTMDATRQLARWRKAPAGCYPARVK